VPHCGKGLGKRTRSSYECRCISFEIWPKRLWSDFFLFLCIPILCVHDKCDSNIVIDQWKRGNEWTRGIYESGFNLFDVRLMCRSVFPLHFHVIQCVPIV